jgi:uncharacterized protein (TIGR02594 family)
MKIIRIIKSFFKRKSATPLKTSSVPMGTEKQIDSIVENKLKDCPVLLKQNTDPEYWKAVLKAMAHAESSFNVLERYPEKGLGKDAVTGLKNVSEGLLQLSYQDSKYHGCEFDWSIDKNKAALDPSKSIFDVKKNIEGGMIILNKQLVKNNLYSRYYWAVLDPEDDRHGVFLNKFNFYYSKKEGSVMTEIDNPWLPVAMKELNTSEVSGDKDNPRIVEYHSATTLKATDDETPWCSSFVSWCLEQSGYKSTKNAWARSYLSFGKKIDKPVNGCIVVFSRGSSSGHVAFFVGETSSTIKVLGGNQGNKVSIAEYPKSRLLGYRMPTDKLSEV